MSELEALKLRVELLTMQQRLVYLLETALPASRGYDSTATCMQNAAAQLNAARVFLAEEDQQPRVDATATTPGLLLLRAS